MSVKSSTHVLDSRYICSYITHSVKNMLICVRTPIQGYTGAHRGTQGYKGVYRGTQGYTGVQRGIQGYTGVHIDLVRD